MPKVSIIIPTYNSERFLQATLDSVLNQTYTDFEIVAVDDGSTDGTKDILSACSDPRLRVFFEEHAGCVANYNRCLSHVEGEYIAVLDHDDIMLPERLERQVAFLDSNTGIYLLGSSYEIIDEEGKVLDRKPMPVGKGNVKKYEMVFNAVQHPTVMYRKQLVDFIGVYNEAYYPSHDSEFILRAITQHSADNLPEVLTQWRRVPDSPTNSQTYLQHEKHYQMRKEANTIAYHANMARYRKAEAAMNLGKVAYYYGKGGEAFKWFRKAIFHGGFSLAAFRYLTASLFMPVIRFMRKRNITLPFTSSRKRSSVNWDYHSP